MKWFQTILTAIALINMVVSPVAAANWSEQDRHKLAQYRDYLEPLGYELTVDPESKNALVFDKNTKKLAMEIPFAEESQLRKFSPKSLNKMMMDEMVRVKTSSKAAWSHSVRNLPAESAIFFMAMGAVVAGQLITNYSQNPIAMKQHVDHSLSPLGVFGFFTFMYSQGVTSNVLAMYMKNPKFHHMIPYLGMTVGAFLQTYLSQVASDPNVKACAKTMMGGSISDKDRAAGVDEDPCSKAYDYLVIQKKIWEFAPGIVSMLISSGLAGVGQSVLTKAVLRITGVDIALWLVPGKMHVTGVRLLLVKGLQIGAFIALDLWLNRKVVSAWKNFFDGREFNEISSNLSLHMNTMKRNQWTSTDGLLHQELKNFHKKMMDWRMMNMSEVYEAHQNWSQALQQLTSMYNSSQSFYGNFISELRNSRFKQSDMRPLERVYPYIGIKAKDLAEGKEDLYYTNPQFLESMQEESIADGVAVAEAFLASPKAKSLSVHEGKQLSATLEKLRSTDRLKKAEGLTELARIFDHVARNITASHYYREMVGKMRELMGNPNPMMEIGRGYLATYEQSPIEREKLKGVNYYRRVGAVATPRITDYLVMQMICGPDIEKGESTVKNSNGFPSVFLPPTIRNTQDDFSICANVGATPMPSVMSYRFPFVSKDKTHFGAVTYLIDRARPSALGTKDQTQFDTWWKTQTESQMQKAFEDYGKEYDTIVAKMIELIYRKDRSSLNQGPISNGAMNAAFQEQRVYLSILRDLLQPATQYKLDIANILKGELKDEATRSVEHQFAILNGLIQSIKVTEIGGRKVINSSLENYQLEEQLTNIQGALKQVSTVLGVGDDATGAAVKLNKNQREVAILCLENLQSLASEIMMYGTMANAVSWEKIRNLKRLNMEQEQFSNEIQAKLAAMRGMSMPGKP